MSPCGLFIVYLGSIVLKYPSSNPFDPPPWSLLSSPVSQGWALKTPSLRLMITTNEI